MGHSAREQDDTRRSSGRWLAVIALVATSVIVALVLAISAATRERDTALKLQEHSYDVMILASNLDATMAQAEATLGRFVISGNKNKNIGQIYADEWRRAGQIVDQLSRAIDDSPRQRTLVEKLERAYRLRGEELAATALRTNYGQNSEALATYYRIGMSPVLPRINALLDALISNERALLAQRTRIADASVARTNGLTALISLAGLVLVASGGFLGWTVVEGLARRRQEERRTAELEDAVADRTVELQTANELLQAEMATREVAEARLRQVQKMEAVGQLTGGIAHDFNNMLAVVISSLELALRKVAPHSPDIRRHLDNAMEGANRAAALTKRLLAFARAEPLLPVPTDPDALVAGLQDMIDRTLGERIEVTITAGCGGWPVLIDQHQLENALLNLAVNSRDAMPDGGALTIATECVTLADQDIADVAAGEYVRIAVGDTGSGMDKAVADRAFEPFFTTKPTGKGTGLGLSQIFGFVRQSGGTLTIESTVGIGTTVSIYLPRYDGSVATASLAPVEQSERTGLNRALWILVVEDDRRVLAATVDTLLELGHRPVPCNHVADAPGLLASYPEIGLILSDVLMPDATGPELVAKLQTQRPDIPAIFVTGYAGDVGDAAAFGRHQVLRKPFTITTLDAAIAAALREDMSEAA